MKRALLAALASAFLFACGDDNEDEKVQEQSDAGGIVVSDAGTKADAGTPGADAGTVPNPSCKVIADFGNVGALAEEDMFAQVDVPANPEMIFLDAYLDDESTDLGIELYAGSGVFAGGLKTGAFEIKGEDLNYKTCGLCVLVYGGDQVEYLATGGTVTLTSIKGQLKGSLSNVTFEHVTIAGEAQEFKSTPVGDGCVSRIGSLSFDAPLELMEE